jgi:hypothetical protein
MPLIDSEVRRVRGFAVTARVKLNRGEYCASCMHDERFDCKRQQG